MSLPESMPQFLVKVAERFNGLGLKIEFDENPGYTTYIIRASHKCGFKTFTRIDKKSFHYYDSMICIDAIIVDFWEYANAKRLFRLINKIRSYI